MCVCAASVCVVYIRAYDSGIKRESGQNEEKKIGGLVTAKGRKVSLSESKKKRECVNEAR